MRKGSPPIRRWMPVLGAAILSGLLGYLFGILYSMNHDEVLRWESVVASGITVVLGATAVLLIIRK